MRPRTIIAALAGVLGVWWWVNWDTGTAEPAGLTSDVTIPSDAADVAAQPVLLVEAAPTASPPSPPAEGIWAEIDSPHDGDAVPRKFMVSGRAGSLPAGHRLMLAVDSGRSVFSPKMPPLVLDGEKWSATVNEYGAPRGGSFSLCVFVVTEEAVEQFTQWHSEGKATGKYPPFRGTLPGGTSLARIKLRVASP